MAQRADDLAAVQEKRSLYGDAVAPAVTAEFAIPAERIEVVLLREKQRRVS